MMKLIGMLFLLSFSAEAILIGRVDIQKVILTVKQGQKIAQELKTEFDKRDKLLKAQEASVTKMREDLSKLGENFNKQRLVMNDDKRAEQERTLQQKAMEIQRKIVALEEQKNKYQAEIRELENKKKGPVIDKVRAVVEAVSKKEGVEFTYENSMAFVVYAKESKDLTDAVIKEYDRRHK